MLVILPSRMVTALPGKVLVVLPSSMVTTLPGKVLVILLSRMLTALHGKSSIILSSSIAATLHNSTDNPDIFVQKASVDQQYYVSTVCSTASVLRQDADVAWDR